MESPTSKDPLQVHGWKALWAEIRQRGVHAPDATSAWRYILPPTAVDFTVLGAAIGAGYLVVSAEEIDGHPLGSLCVAATEAGLCAARTPMTILFPPDDEEDDDRILTE